MLQDSESAVNSVIMKCNYGKCARSNCAWRRLASARAWSSWIMPAPIHSTEMCHLHDIVCALNIKFVNSMNQMCVLFLAETHGRKYNFRTW